MGQHSAFAGNNIKSMHNSLNASLKKLRTDYVDVLYLHWWDYTTSVEEVMDGLHALVMQGKVLYLGVSDTPAWIVAKANAYARYNGKTPFAIYQGMWSVMDRDFERDILPMCIAEGALARAQCRVILMLMRGRGRPGHRAVERPWRRQDPHRRGREEACGVW